MNSDLDFRILSAWDGPAPLPERDILFRIAVMERMERRAYQANLSAVIAAGLAGGLLFWLALPSIIQAVAISSLDTTALVTIAMIIGLAVAAWGTNKVYRFI